MLGDLVSQTDEIQAFEKLQDCIYNTNLLNILKKISVGHSVEGEVSLQLKIQCTRVLAGLSYDPSVSIYLCHEGLLDSSSQTINELLSKTTNSRLNNLELILLTALLHFKANMAGDPKIAEILLHEHFHLKLLSLSVRYSGQLTTKHFSLIVWILRNMTKASCFGQEEDIGVFIEIACAIDQLLLNCQ